MFQESAIDTILNRVNAELKVNDLDRLSALLGQRSGEVRELFQKVCESEMKRIVNKLRSCKPLNSEELDLIRKFIVGDAEYYEKMENNLEDWKHELSRLIQEYRKYDKPDLSREALLALMGIIRDFRMLLPSVKYFLDCDERVKRFEAMSGDGIDLGEANILAGLLEQQLKSPDV